MVLAGCNRKETKGTVLAQVGDATLTLEELRESFPAEFEQLIRREQYLDFIKRWIDDEVIYQQAVKNKLADDAEVKRKLAKLSRKVLIEEFLGRDNGAEGFEPDEMAMNQYYEMHKEDFRRKVPEIKYIHIRMQTAKQAQDIRYRLTGDNFLALAAAHSLDATPESYASIAFKKQTELPACLAQDIIDTRPGSVTRPIACPDGHYLVKVMERQEAGSNIAFAEAREEIAGTLVMERKDKLLESRIAKYKEGIAINFNLDHIPGMAEARKGPEAAASMPIPRPAEPGAGAAENVPAPKVAVSRRKAPPAAEAAAPVHDSSASPATVTPGPPPASEEKNNVPKTE